MHWYIFKVYIYIKSNGDLWLCRKEAASSDVITDELYNTWRKLSVSIPIHLKCSWSAQPPEKTPKSAIFSFTVKAIQK